jgi:hypothetical protein
VGGNIDLKWSRSRVGAFIPAIPAPKIEWGGKYIRADGIFTEIVDHKGNVYRVRRIARTEIEYLVTDGDGNYAHGATLKEAKDDLVYKTTKRRKSGYEGLKTTDILTHDDAIMCYRVITGACSTGVRDFVKNRLGDRRKDEYTIAEIITITEVAYGSRAFKSFFEGK